MSFGNFSNDLSRDFASSKNPLSILEESQSDDSNESVSEVSIDYSEPNMMSEVSMV